MRIFSWLILQENGTLLLIFDAIGFELNLDNPKQSTFIAPDSTMFNLVPGLPADSNQIIISTQLESLNDMMKQNVDN